MTDDNTPENTDSQEASVTGNDTAAASPTANRRPSPAKKPPVRRRRWPYVVAGIIVLLLILVLLTPAILSTGPGRSFVVGRINDNLNGRIEVADWSLSWTGGMSINGLRVFDDRNSQIAQIEFLSTELSLVDAVRGNFAVGNTVIRGDFTAVRHADGSTNFARLVKASDQPDEPPSDLPNISGTIRIENSRGTFVRNTGDPATSQKVKMSDISATVMIANINEPIDHALSVTAAVNDGTPGTLTVKGKADVVADRRVNLDAATFDETINLSELDAGAVAAFVPPDVIRQIGGMLNGTIIAQSTDGKTVVLRSQIDGKQVIFATSAFAGGEAYRTPTLTLALLATLSLPNGLSDFQAGTIQTDGPVALKTAHVDFSLAADAPIATLLSAAANETPKQPGKINQRLSVDLPPLATMLPGTLGLRPDAKLESGRLQQSITADLSSGQSQFALALNVTQLEGSTESLNSEGKPIRQRFTVQPIDVTLASISHGGGWKAPDLSDLKLTLASGFASGEFVAPTLASLKGSIDVELAKMKTEIGQFAQLQDIPMRGKIHIAADSTGDPTRPADPATFGVTVTGHDLHTVINGQTLNQPLVRARVGGTVLRTESGDVKQIRDLRVSAITGSEASPTIDLQIDLPTVQYVASAGEQPARYDVPSFTITRADVALKSAQDEFGGLFPALQEVALSGGVATVSGSGSHVSGVTRFDATLSASDLDVGSYLAESATAPGVRQRNDILRDYNLTAKIVGTYGPLPTGGAKLTIATLTVDDNRKLLSLSNAGDLAVTMPPEGTPAAAGKLSLGLDLPQTHDLLRQFSGPPQEAPTLGEKPVLITQGRLTGTLDLSQQPDGRLVVALNGGVDALTLTGEKPVVTNEKVTLKVKAAAEPGMATAVLEQLQLASAIATVDATGQFVLKSGAGEQARIVPPLQRIKRLVATITTPDVAKLQAVIDAFQSAKGSEVALASTAPEQVVAAADGKLPAGTPNSDTAAAEPTMVEQIAEIRVSELSASGVGATINLKQPIVANSPAALVELLAGPRAVQTPQLDPPAPAGQPPATQPAPVPPAKLAGGSATLRLDMTGNGQTLTIVPDVAAQKLSLSVGEAHREIGDITLKSTLAIVSRPDAAPAPSDAQPTLAGAFTLTGQLEPLMEQSAFLGGEKPTSAYAGTLNFEQTIGTEGTVIKVSGGGAIADFVARDTAGKPAFTEQSIRIADDLSLDTDEGTLSLSRVAVVFESSGALNLEANGKINDFGRRRTIEYVLANVSYDAAKICQILWPNKDYVVEGKATRQFALAGSLPAVDAAGNPVPMREALRSLAARGSIALDRVQAEGLTIQGIELPLSLTGGVLKVIDVAKPDGQQLPAPYACNGGTINVAGIEINLNGDVPLLSTPPNLAILSKVQLNAALSKFLGDLVNNPLFVPSADTKGVVDVTIVGCRDVPMGEPFKQQRGNNGYATATFDFSGAQFKNEFIIGLTNSLEKFANLKLDADSWQGSIRDGKVTYKSGYVGHDMTLVLGERQEKTIRLYGDTRLEDRTMVPMTMLFSSSWFGGDFSRYIPKGLPVALTGPFTAPRYDLAQAVQATVRQNYPIGNPEDIGRIIDLFSGKKKDDRPANDPPRQGADPATKPAPKPQDPLGVVGDLIGQAAKERERKEQEKKEKRERERGER